MAASDEAASDEVQLALAALTERIPIITRSVITKRGDYALSYFDCGCRRRSEQRQQVTAAITHGCRLHYIGQPPRLFEHHVRRAEAHGLAEGDRVSDTKAGEPCVRCKP